MSVGQSIRADLVDDIFSLHPHVEIIDAVTPEDLETGDIHPSSEHYPIINLLNSVK